MSLCLELESKLQEKGDLVTKTDNLEFDQNNLRGTVNSMSTAFMAKTESNHVELSNLAESMKKSESKMQEQVDLATFNSMSTTFMVKTDSNQVELSTLAESIQKLESKIQEPVDLVTFNSMSTAFMVKTESNQVEDGKESLESRLTEQSKDLKQSLMQKIQDLNEQSEDLGQILVDEIEDLNEQSKE